MLRTGQVAKDKPQEGCSSRGFVARFTKQKPTAKNSTETTSYPRYRSVDFRDFLCFLVCV